ncbi:receptor-like serine/threonine-protein kinase SD1-7 [Dioscorea cayenensis subsp. rotundata]|uniref:non-specific serine/threonine protein kinase n=1 Tax=Dioscorea cayennensis subsp. rotundata TaxID=55577 RepID=A0AB40BH69_DIOCR|nr:receptor-like serine/threonine-protein kinase SD1-7 [Dioscorea cayenensis subsp. rotundata]
MFISAYMLWKSTKKHREARKMLKEAVMLGKASNPHAILLENDVTDAEGFGLPSFSFDIIAAATNNFHENNKLGEGGYGPVFKGKLSNGQEIAVKRLSKQSMQGLDEFMNEVFIISKIQHRNLVRLLGCCIDGEEKLLIYEFLTNKSLDAFLFDSTKCAQLDWRKRYNIIIGIARGLVYLHRDSRLKIIHRDMKASNILLDEQFNPKISDFGMAQIIGEDQNLEKTTRVVGTIGYMAPEYMVEGQYSEKTDVFSFGVLLLEIMSGQRNKFNKDRGDDKNLLGTVWRLWVENEVLEVIDPSLGESWPPSDVLKCIKVGLLCVQEFPEDRPTMAAVISMLSTKDDIDFPSPKRSALFRHTQSSLYTEETSINALTLTKLQCR